jgi:hypothetical protein
MADREVSAVIATAGNVAGRVDDSELTELAVPTTVVIGIETVVVDWVKGVACTACAGAICAGADAALDALLECWNGSAMGTVTRFSPCACTGGTANINTSERPLVKLASNCWRLFMGDRITKQITL